MLDPHGSAIPLLHVLEDNGVHVHALEIEDAGDNRLVGISADMPVVRTAAVLDALKGLEEVRRVEWHS
jgi:hypothetical protein